MGLKIEQQWASIGLKHYPSKLEVQSSPGDFEIKGGTAEIRLEHGVGYFKTDSTPFYESIGLYKQDQFRKNLNAVAKREINESINRYVKEGDMMANFHKYGFLLSKTGGDGAWSKEKTVEVKATQGANVKFQPKEFSAEADIQPLQVKASPDRVDVNITRTVIEMYLEQKPSIHIEWAGSILDALK